VSVIRDTCDVAKLIACDGPCETVRAWCPDCDRETEHVRISPTFRECTVCGELSADITSVPCSESGTVTA
jgi:ribosomal protein L37AE/L43A